MNLSFYLTYGEAVKYLCQQLHQKVSYYDHDNLIRAKDIEPPQLIGRRRLWSIANLKETEKALRIRRAKRPVLTGKRIFSRMKYHSYNDYYYFVYYV
jgi:hypothetical protein